MGIDALAEEPLFTLTRLIVIDFEALTPAGRSPVPIEVAATEVAYGLDGRLTRRRQFVSLLRPPSGIPVTWRERQVGFTKEMLDGARPASAVMRELDQTFFADTPHDTGGRWPFRLIAHNAHTENLLIFGQRQHCPGLARTPLLDSVKLARAALPALSSHSLSAVAHAVRVPIPPDRHRAAADVELTINVLEQLLQKGAWRGLHDLDRAARVEPKRPASPRAAQPELF